MMRKHGAIIFHDADITTCGFMWQMQNIVLFDILRSGIPCYSTVEQFKNGHVISQKHLCQTKSQMNMKVAMFLNHHPHCEQFLSADSIQILDLDMEQQFEPVQKRITDYTIKSPKSPTESIAESLKSTSTTKSLERAYKLLELDEELEQEDIRHDNATTIASHYLIRTAQVFGPIEMEEVAKLVKGYFNMCEENGGAVNVRECGLACIDSDDEDMQSARPKTPDKKPPLPEPNAPQKKKRLPTTEEQIQEWKDVKKNIAELMDSNKHADNINQGFKKKSEEYDMADDILAEALQEAQEEQDLEAALLEGNTQVNIP